MSAIEQIIDGVKRDLGRGFSVMRVLPAVTRRRVGPFVFFDHFGPVTLQPGVAVDVRPHPHIGLATVTYLFDGQLMHRDSLGNAQRIKPGDVNWMTAGRGIVHSERTPEDMRARTHQLHGMQVWVALPTDAEETAPNFVHTPMTALPRYHAAGVQVRVILGRAFGARSPVATFSETVYCALEFEHNAELAVAPEHAERAVYVGRGELEIEGTPIQRGQMAVLDPGSEVRITARSDTRAVLLGGASVGERIVWWNFVATRRDRIEQAKLAWAQQKMGKVPGERDDDFMPLPAE